MYNRFALPHLTLKLNLKLCKGLTCSDIWPTSYIFSKQSSCYIIYSPSAAFNTSKKRFPLQYLVNHVLLEWCWEQIKATISVIPVYVQYMVQTGIYMIQKAVLTSQHDTFINISFTPYTWMYHVTLLHRTFFLSNN